MWYIIDTEGPEWWGPIESRNEAYETAEQLFEDKELGDEAILICIDPDYKQAEFIYPPRVLR